MPTQEPFDPDQGLSPEELKKEQEKEEKEKAENPELWKKNNEWLSKFAVALENITPEKEEEVRKLVERFLNGEITWAELQAVPPQLLFQMAEFGYMQFQRGKLKEAETIFKGLSVLDHKRSYYHSILGAIYQRMDKLVDALAEYTVALEMDPKNIACYVNRGEIYYKFGYIDEPLEDFAKAIALDPQSKDPWANRARFLKNMLLQESQQ